MNEILTSLAKFEFEIFNHYNKYTDKRNDKETLYIDTSTMTKSGDTYFEYKDQMLEFINEKKVIGKYTFERINNDIKITI